MHWIWFTARVANVPAKFVGYCVSEFTLSLIMQLHTGKNSVDGQDAYNP